MDDNQRLQLQNMIKINDTTDQTELIRTLKHSDILRENVNKLIDLKALHFDNPDFLHLEAMHECSFLYTYYSDIYNRIRKDELDLNILFKFLDTLKEIEEEKLDQHEASYKVGTLLKKIYVDSALRKANKLNENDEENKTQAKEEENVGLKISWSEYKKAIVKSYL